MRFAKEAGPAVLLVGHVTKGGGIAGPKTLEHIVDTVLYFEGESTLDHRILRAVKNRFGSVDEIGVFEMTGAGLVPVADPAAAFLAGRTTGVSGSAVTALMEGTRPLLVEIQALASRTGFGTPQRVATGLDHRRLAVLLAVLERRGGLPFSQPDGFVDVTRGGAPLQAAPHPPGEGGPGSRCCCAPCGRSRPTPTWPSWSSPCRRASPPGRRSGSRRSSVSASHSSPAARAGRNRCARGLPPCRQAPASCWCTTARDRS